MGDRGNIFVNGGSYGNTYLYSHWSGYELPLVLKKALARKARWDDSPYLTRIIFDAMTEGQQGAETGYGISAEMGDNSHKIVLVNVDAQRVGFVDEGQEATHEGDITFTDYIALSDDELLSRFTS